jgi:hypothetical protein
MADRSTGPRRTFAPVVLLGLAAGGAAALAGSRAWATFDQRPDGSAGTDAYTSSLGVSLSRLPEAPLVTALALVVLACWGVLLVTRRRFRRAVAVLGLVASLGTLAAALVAFVTVPGDLRESFSALGVPVDVGRPVWPYLGVVAALVSVGATAAAVRLVPGWPEMGSRYDAPGSAPPPRDETSLDLWRAMDDGRDPTLPPERRTDP